MKRRKKNRKAFKFLIGIISIIIFSSLGITYAYWTDSIKVNAFVSTGNIDVDFECFSFERACLGCFDWLDAWRETYCYNGHKYYKDNVIKTSGYVPRGDYKLNFIVRNRGSLPVTFLNPIIEVENKPWCRPYGLEMRLKEAAITGGKGEEIDKSLGDDISQVLAMMESSDIEAETEAEGENFSEGSDNLPALSGPLGNIKKKPKELKVYFEEQIQGKKIDVWRSISNSLVFYANSTGYYTYKVRIPYTFYGNKAYNPAVDNNWVKELVIYGDFWIH